MKPILAMIAVAFAVTLAVIIGQRMSTDAMAVVIGVAVGVASAIPTTLLIVALIRREQARSEQPRSEHIYPQSLPPASSAWNSPSLGGSSPNIIVIDPAQYAAQRNANGYPLPPPENSIDGGLRRLRVVGSETDWE